MQTKLVLRIKDMDCSSCVINIDSLMEEQEGISESRTSYAKQQTTIVYNPQKVKPQQLQTVLKQAGFESEIIAH